MLIGPKYKICKRLGSGVFEKCQTQKFALAEGRRTKKSERRPRALSDFGKRLLEKQRARFTYGIPDRQLARYVKESQALRQGDPTEPLYRRLEMRLDNTVYRLGIAHTRRLARQMVSHGHIAVNGRRCHIPSRELHIGDVISVREGSKTRALFLNVANRIKEHTPPAWLRLKAEDLSGSVVGNATKESELFINLPAVVEYYNR